MASVLIGICAGYMIKVYLDAPESFAFKDHFALVCIIIAMVLFIIGHLASKET